MDVDENFEKFAATNDPTKGPVFGLDDLTINYDAFIFPRESHAITGRAYSLPDGYDGSNEKVGFGLFAETEVFTWDDLEVFYYDGELHSL